MQEKQKRKQKEIIFLGKMRNSLYLCSAQTTSKAMKTQNASHHFPACYVELPPYTEGRRAAFYLAVEEYVAHEMPTDNYFFTWQLRPTVVMGRNQVAHQEIDLDFCHKTGIDIIRRRSGGGAIFADENNLMTSLITEEGSVESLFEGYAETIANTLCYLGAPAKVTGRNDIILESGGKVCGNAFYHTPGHCIIHGTMLYDTNPHLMEGALQPSASKMKSKGVKSVRSRIDLLKDYLEINVYELRKQLRTLLTDRSITLTDNDIQKIEVIEQKYYDPHFLFGNTSHADVTKKQHIEGCGMLEINLQLEGSLIQDITLTGDYFDLGDAQSAFKLCLTGLPYSAENLQNAIRKHHPERNIRGLNETSLINLLIS